MKKLLTVIALATLVASPALARNKAQISTNPDAMRAYASAGLNSYVVVSNGQIIGRDPDLNVRLSLLRDAPAEQGSGN